MHACMYDVHNNYFMKSDRSGTVRFLTYLVVFIVMTHDLILQTVPIHTGIGAMFSLYESIFIL